MMNIQNKIENLPSTIEDLSKFVLVGREKLISVRAEIKAINKLDLAQDVRNQKYEEASLLSEALLDAEAKLGEMMKTIPKEKNQYSARDSGVPTKKEAIENLGFTKKQAQRFETLADNPDLVEQVKAEARENNDLPTRSQVLSLAKEKVRRAKADSEQLDRDEEVYKKYRNYTKPLNQLAGLIASTDSLESIVRYSGLSHGGKTDGLNHEIEVIDDYIATLLQIKESLQSARRKENYFE